VIVEAGTLADLSRIENGLEIIERIRPAISDVVEHAEMDKYSILGTCRLGTLSVADLSSLRDDGHVVRLDLREGSWEAAVVFDGPANPVIDVSGRPEDAFSSAQLSQLDRAVDQRDAFLLLQTASDLDVSLRVLVRNDPAESASHWALSLAELEAQLGGTEWMAAVLALGRGPRVVTVSAPAEMGLLVVGQLLIRGARDAYELDNVPQLAEPDRAFRFARGLDGRAEFPSPLRFASVGEVTTPVGAQSTGVRLGRVAAGVSRCLVWHWLATSSATDDGKLSLTVSGARVVSFDLRPELCDTIASELALYLWSASGDDPARIDAMEQAVSLAITDSADIASGSGPALRTARSLYELARRGAVSEALATRRAARESALATARYTADAAREAAGKSIERTLVQIGAVVGVAVTDFSNVISNGQAIVLLSVLGALAVVFLIVTECFSLRSAGEGLSAGLADLDQYRESLASDDLETIRQAQTVAVSRDDLSRARWMVAIIYTAAVAASGIAIGLAIVHTHHSGT
jgi:hypothetical protein